MIQAQVLDSGSVSEGAPAFIKEPDAHDYPVDVIAIEGRPDLPKHRLI